MIRKFFGKLFGNAARPKIIAHKTHRIPPDRISRAALKVCETLQQHGFAAYVVGGAVRDLLLGHEPTDFDVATGSHFHPIEAVIRQAADLAIMLLLGPSLAALLAAQLFAMTYLRSEVNPN